MTKKQKYLFDKIKEWKDMDEDISIQSIIFEVWNDGDYTEKQLGGVATSLQKDGYIKVEKYGNVTILKEED